MNTHDIEPLQDAADLLRSYLKLCKSLPRGDSYHLGRIERAIAAIEAARQARGEPVACFKCGHAKHDGECVNVAPQPQQVPEPSPLRESMSSNHRSYAAGWNDCRAAMLEAAPEVKE